MPHVVIVGGGLTGPAAAFRLKQTAPGVSVTLLEAGGRVGGNVGTELHDGFRVEAGPNGFLDTKPFLPQLCRDLGLAGRLITGRDAARKNRFLYLRGKLHQMPAGPLGLLTSPLLSPRGKWDLFAEPFRRPKRPRHDESVAEFVARRAGKEAARVFADALVTGIHGGDPAELSAAAAFPRLPVLERTYGGVVRGFIKSAKRKKRDALARGEPPPGPPRMWSFREGLQVLTDALAADLGPAVQTGVSVKRITRTPTGWAVHADGRDAWPADAVVLACPAYEQAAMLADLDPPLADLVAGIRYNRIAVVAVGYRQADCPGVPDGFGYIAPQHTRRDLLGVQWCSSIYPDRAPAGHVLWRALCGGVHRGDVLQWDDARLVRAVHAELRLALGVAGDPVFSRVVRWPRAIPQYVVGHLDRVGRIDAAAARHPGLFLTGNAYRGVALGDCAEQGERVAGAVAGFLGRAG
ncbi:MAG: protoporphyrinogen oxidase [Gemmataceae bacterium]|nr:protoporphyrinogen oxidase [Gemmataceae bacterium]